MKLSGRPDARYGRLRPDQLQQHRRPIPVSSRWCGTGGVHRPCRSHGQRDCARLSGHQQETDLSPTPRTFDRHVNRPAVSRYPPPWCRPASARLRARSRGEACRRPTAIPTRRRPGRPAHGRSSSFRARLAAGYGNCRDRAVATAPLVWLQRHPSRGLRAPAWRLELARPEQRLVGQDHRRPLLGQVLLGLFQVATITGISRPVPSTAICRRRGVAGVRLPAAVCANGVDQLRVEAGVAEGRCECNEASGSSPTRVLLHAHPDRALALTCSALRLAW
jgi:hypothetical protein